MQTTWVPFDGTRYLAIDKIALARNASTLLPLLPLTDPSDSYDIERTLRPLVLRALSHSLDSPILDRSGVIGAKYFFERREGTLPGIFTPEFNTALSRFLVRAMSMPLEEPKLKTVDGKMWALIEMEEPGDWPGKVKYE